MINKNRLMDTMLQLVSVPGISGTNSENLTCDKIYDLLNEIPYFKENPSMLKKVKIKDDKFNRTFISAMIEANNNCKKTIILCGHYDVVDVEEFGHLKNIAFNPVEFTKRVSELTLDDNAKHDLDSGNWLFGRGTADMKFGIALCIELLREYSNKQDLKGNILFLAVPGEESNSEGMLSASGYLKTLQTEQQFDFEALLLAECYMNDDYKDETRFIHFGACGKIMPLFFFAGKETHVSEPFDGLDPTMLASEVNKLFELNPEFSESKLNVNTPPPICLKLSDLKNLYSVQTSLYAASYYNLITLDLQPDLLIDKLKRICLTAFDNTLSLMNKRKIEYGQKFNENISSSDIKPCVMTFEELYKEVKNIYGKEFDLYLDGKINEWNKENLENQQIAINIVKETYEKYPDKIPMIIIAFAPPYYPDRYPIGDKANRLLEVVDDIIHFAKVKFNENMKKVDYYMGICDMSYTGFDDDKKINLITPNMPGINKNYMFPVNDLKSINIPAIVLGGCGKDFHKYTERLNIPYSFNVVPELFIFTINKLLNK